MGNHASLLQQSQIPGLSAIFGTSSASRKTVLVLVFSLLTYLTLRDLESIVADYFRYPITVSVLVTESRVLPFPAVTVCNLNPVHRGRFCTSDLEKPANIEQILCSSLSDLFEVCKITEALEDLVQDGKDICEGKKSDKKSKKRGFKRPKSVKRPGSGSKGGRRIRKPAGGRFRPSTGNQSVTDSEAMSSSNNTDKTYFLSLEGSEEAGASPRRRAAGGGGEEILPPESDDSVMRRSMNPITQRFIDRKIKSKTNTSTQGMNNMTTSRREKREISSTSGGTFFDSLNIPTHGDANQADVTTTTRRKIYALPVLSFKSAPRSGSVDGSGGGGSCRRSKRETQFNLRSLLATFKSIQSGDLSGGLLQPFTESGGLVDTIVIQVAALYGITVNSTRELLPAIFMKAFTDVTGCSVGSARGNENTTKTNPVNAALDNLTTIFQETGCIWKAPKLIKLFQATSSRLISQLTSCTRPWVNDLLGFNASSEAAQAGETPWFLLLDLLENWLASLSRVSPEKAMAIGHQANDLIKSCYFAGKKCEPDKDFKATFYSQHGNCFTYAMDSGEAEKESLSGFTGPKFGLELMFNLEKDAYMPTSRESGVKIVVHDRGQKADPDQDAINIAPGVVTYVGVQMMNISRLPAPYQDNCVDDWPDTEDAAEYKKWALALHHETYTIQVCLKICLQLYTIKVCKCWTSSALWPPYADISECTARGTKGGEECVDLVRHLYYEEKIQCHCPPRCSDRIYERFLSTGQETRQCSAIQSEEVEEEEPAGGQQEKSSADDKENTAKVIVYFHSLSFNEIRQDRKYTLEGLLGAIGGILGVYLGFSIFSFYEMIELVFRGFCNAVGQEPPVRRNRTAANEPANSSQRTRRHSDRSRRRRN